MWEGRWFANLAVGSVVSHRHQGVWKKMSSGKWKSRDGEIRTNKGMGDPTFWMVGASPPLR